MFDRLTLHIGHQKTGTTSLQETFRINARRLAADGLFYWTGAGAHHTIAKSFRPALSDGRMQKTRAAFLAACERATGPEALVSSEDFVRLANEDVAEAARVFRAIAREVRVVIYVRHPVGLIASLTHQGLRIGRRLAVSAEMAKVVPVSKFVRRWAAVFGAQNVCVRPFDRAQLAGGDVIDDLIATMGRQPLTLKRVRLNDGFSVLGGHLLDRALHQAGGRIDAEIAKVFAAIPGPRYVPAQHVLDRGAETGAPDLAFLKTAYGITLTAPELVPTAPPALSDEALDREARNIMRKARAGLALRNLTRQLNLLKA